jgi:hypothetical protein
MWNQWRNFFFFWNLYGFWLCLHHELPTYWSALAFPGAHPAFSWVMPWRETDWSQRSHRNHPRRGEMKAKFLSADLEYWTWLAPSALGASLSSSEKWKHWCLSCCSATQVTWKRSINITTRMILPDSTWVILAHLAHFCTKSVKYASLKVRDGNATIAIKYTAFQLVHILIKS